MRGAELFAGCGGLALGMSRAGFSHALMAEFNHDAVATVLHNRAQRVKHVEHWPMELTDVRNIDWSRHAGSIDIVSGGPPCQPFGIGGKKRGHEDSRDMWPEAVRAVCEAQPDAFLFENVRNLAGPRFAPYLEWIKNCLRHPADKRRIDEDFVAHSERLRLSQKPAAYEVISQVVNAADYGAPQIRYRVLIFGLSAKLETKPLPMERTHSRERLIWDQFVTGEYWRRHNIKPRGPTARDRALADALLIRGKKPRELPWVTVRDALKGLGEPTGENNHVFQSGARVYKGHTGSLLDQPAKALKAGDHGVPGGENMMVRDDGSVRYFTLREAARLVGLPNEYVFPTSWSESMRQLGNAVPAQLGEAAGRWIRDSILEARERIDSRAVA